MTTPTVASTPRRYDGFRHDAFFYATEQQFLDGVLPFIRGGLDRRAPILVVVDPPKIDLLRNALDGDAHRVGFADMRSLGRNPALIIPAWQQFVGDQGTSPAGVRGIGEPIWPGRNGAELVECQYHETLLNLAFADTPSFRLLCPYDAARLETTVIDEARRAHPLVTDGHTAWRSECYGGLDRVSAAFADPLPDPPRRPQEFSFQTGMLPDVRAFVYQHATNSGLSATRTAELVLAVNEVVTNSLRHGGGHGTLAAWRDDYGVICDVRDGGRISRPLVGRERPTTDQEGGRGLWLANQLCDLVQIRSSLAGTIVRLHMRR
jgi:anti-sigma regulatory factor (Ser/Thr protein kinase)